MTNDIVNLFSVTPLPHLFFIFVHCCMCSLWAISLDCGYWPEQVSGKAPRDQKYRGSRLNSGSTNKTFLLLQHMTDYMHIRISKIKFSHWITVDCMNQIKDKCNDLLIGLSVVLQIQWFFFYSIVNFLKGLKKLVIIEQFLIAINLWSVFRVL